MRDRLGAGCLTGFVIGNPAADKGKDTDRGRDDDQQGERSGEPPQPAGRPAGGLDVGVLQSIGGVDELALQCVRFVGTAVGPVERGGQPCAAEQIGWIAAAGIPLGRSRCDSLMEPTRFAILVEPGNQSRPLAEQRFVRDLGCTVADRHEASIGERGEHARRTGFGELGQRHVPANVRLFAGSGEATENTSTDRAVIGAELEVGLLGEAGDRAGDSACLQVAGAGEHDPTATHPRLEQRRGEKRECAGLGGDVVGNRVRESRLESESGALRGPHDRRSNLIGGHRTDEHLAVAHEAGERRMLGGLLVVVGAERDRDDETAVELCHRVYECIKTRGADAGVLGREELLELVHDEHASSDRVRGRLRAEPVVLEEAQELGPRCMQDLPPLLAAGQRSGRECREEAGPQER